MARTTGNIAPSYPPKPEPPHKSAYTPPVAKPTAPAPPSSHAIVKINSANASIRALPSTAKLVDYLTMARQAGCSDLHLVPCRKPLVRKQGQLVFLEEAPLSPERAKSLNFSLLTDDQKRHAEEHLQYEYAMEIPGAGRHRCNVFQQRVGWEGAYRIVPNYVPSLADIDAPPILQKLTEFHQGLILVTGPAGSGKTTTVAAMLDHINRHRTDHIITVEDPIEYILVPDKCQITQREVGNHTDNFGVALRGALRQDPDVIMVGELRDKETTGIAISAAETGHLVFATLHTNNTIRTVARILDVYPVSQRAQICVMVAESLRGIISQQLIPRRDGTGRVSAMEILIFTTGVAQIVKEGKSHQLLSHMQSGKRQGMQIMSDAIMSLYQNKVISGKEAWMHSENKDLFDHAKGEN
jgi:twitching motility protein PilT